MKRLLLGFLALALFVAPAIAFDPVAKYYSTPKTFVDGDATPVLSDSAGRPRVIQDMYGSHQTPLVSASGNVANAAATATLTGTATTTVYISGFEVTGGGSTAAALVTCTLTGVLGGTKSYTYGFTLGATLYNLPLVVEFAPPLPASAVNTPIVASCPAGGAGNTNTTMVAHGLYQ